MNISQIPKRISKVYNRLKEFHRYKEILKKNDDLGQIKSGKTCFIIGNGPSIKDINMTLLADKNTFMMNSFWRHPQYKDIRPKYYVAASMPRLLSENPDRPRYVQDEDLPGSARVISQVPETKLFFPIAVKEYIEKNKFFPKNPIYYILQHGLMYENLKFNLDASKPIPFTKNTFLLAMMLAVYMGFETLYLLGCEHNFLDQLPKKWFLTFKHFYEEPSKIVPQEYQEHTYENAIENALRLFKNYRFLKEKLAIEKPNVKIYNATPNSFLDVFPFINLDEILKK